MNNQQLQAAIDSLHQLAGSKEAWTTAKEIAINQLRKLYEIQAIRAGLMVQIKEKNDQQ